VLDGSCEESSDSDPRHDFEQFCKSRLYELQVFVRSQCADATIVEEVVQETFVAALGAWAKVGAFDNPMGWLIKTARLKLARAMKQAAARNGREISVDLLVYQPFQVPIDDADAAIQLRALVARLSPRQAEVWVLDWLGYPVAEIADLLEIGPNTVRAYRGEARQRMQAMIDDDLKVRESEPE
jgi:RNA polymerase sigma factor (sigma-70 family)